MSSTLDTYRVIQWTQHYVRLHGEWYREAWIEDAAGCVRFVAILDDTLDDEV